MKRTNINRLNAAITTCAFCDNTAADTAGITAFAPLVTVIKGKIVIVQGFNQQGDTPTTGVTVNVKAIREAMMQHTYKLGAAISSYGASLTPPDNDLMAQAKVTKGSLETLSKEECATECNRIRQLASANAVNIVAFGVVAGDITDTGNLVTLYMNGINDPRAAKITANNAKKQANLALNNIMDTLLTKQLDTMANTLRYTNVSWWNQYHLSREIIDLGISHTRLNMFIKDAGGDAIEGATASLLQNNLVVYFASSGADGKIAITKIKPGTFTLRTEKTNFSPKTEAGIQFKPGKQVKRTVILTAGVITAPTGSAVREGDLGPGINTNVNLVGINGTAATTITLEATGSPFRVYAAANITDPPGPVFLDVLPGIPVTKLGTVLASELGLDSTKTFLMVQNIGATPGHWKFTFDNLLP